MKRNNKGYTLVEVIVSFSLIMIVMIYLLRTIVVISEKNAQLLLSQEYNVFENILLDKVYKDLNDVNNLTILNDGSTITFNEINKELEIDVSNKSIIYDDIIYELPEGVIFKDNPYKITTGESNSFYVIDLNLQINKKDKNLKIVYQKQNSTPTENQKVCKRASTLHTETCTHTNTSYYCSGAGYTESGSKGTTTITYGNDPSTRVAGTLVSGDAFDCDVNGDGTYDSATERFYYVTDLEGSNNVAVLIYYNNVSGGEANNTSSGLIAYDSTHGTGASAQNLHGPITAITNLPTNSQWKNVSLINKVRTITNEEGGSTTSGGTLPSNFSYEGYAARLLTVQEVNKACGITIGLHSIGELDTCNYLMENTLYSSTSMGAYGYWLENPTASYSSEAWYVYGNYRLGGSIDVSNGGDLGSRPVIEVLKSDISY